MTAAVNLAVLGNGPAFSAYSNSIQALSNSTQTKINFNTEEFDTNSCYDPTLYRFTPNVAGYYRVTAQTYMSGASGGYAFINLYKNGTGVKLGNQLPLSSITGIQIIVTTLIYANGSTDYFEIYAWQNSGGALNCGGSVANQAYFCAELARAA